MIKLNKIYIFSGLGVDERVFTNIDLSDVPAQFIPWIAPLKNETIESYAQRISKDFEKDCILIGLSFGGMLAVEIAKIIPVQKVILIASAKNKNELPQWFLLAGALQLHHLVPTFLLKSTNFFTYWLFGAHSSAEKKLLNTIIKDTDAPFLHWAIDQIVNWNNQYIPTNCIHIHGTNDHILPIKNVHADYIIPNGGHFMTVNRAKVIEKLLKKELVQDSENVKKQ